MPKLLALLVDDEPELLELLSMTLARMDIESICAETLAQARACLAQHEFFLCLTDMRLPDGDGIDLVRHIQQAYSKVPVAVITAYGNIEGAVNTLKAGAFDYVSKPVDLTLLRRLVNTAARMNQQTHRFSPPEEILVGQAPAMIALRAQIEKVARSQAPVFIQGESGTGKEVVARLVHQLGPRSDQEFVGVNCGAIPTELMESEFFGHKKGSFTGATSDKKGLFQAAVGGSLFLDEIAELPLHMQVKLLRVIQEKSVRPIGAQSESSVDVRIISASHKDLASMVSQNQFRQDLFYRINVISLRVPSLRERPEDIPVLTQHLLQQLGDRHEKSDLSLSDGAMRELQRYSFPGNVRELENILERALTLADGDQIQKEDLQLPTAPTVDATVKTRVAPLTDIIQTQEKAAITAALDRHKWNRTAAAKELGITFRALRYRLKKFEL